MKTIFILDLMIMNIAKIFSSLLQKKLKDEESFGRKWITEFLQHAKFALTKKQGKIWSH